MCVGGLWGEGQVANTFYRPITSALTTTTISKRTDRFWEVTEVALTTELGREADRTKNSINYDDYRSNFSRAECSGSGPSVLRTFAGMGLPGSLTSPDAQTCAMLLVPLPPDRFRP